MTVASTLTQKREASAQTFVVVLLAGALRPSPLRRQLDIPVLALPLADETLLLDRWLRTIGRTEGCRGVKIVLSSKADAKRISDAIARSRSLASDSDLAIDVIVDPKDWRGPAGLLRDIAHQSQLCDDDVVLAAEAACLPPDSLNALIDEIEIGASGIIAGSRCDEPAGMYAFCASVVSAISPVGFYDIKEQLLPDLYRRGRPVRRVQVVDQVVRIRDLASYLRAVEVTHTRKGLERTCAASATISPSARISPGSYIGHNAVVEDGAVIQSSVILDGARIGGGAVVANSVIGPDQVIGPRDVVRGAVRARAGAGEASSAKRLATRLAVLSRVHGRGGATR